ncbi:hypothetical protein DPEC_G00283080 [Dallia pectoralis]|uniref:Uncharacterized protein n=1 Tax=Dallia pectoralis TaxID=75939 RepID=A0ACC2FJ75_DALPE|nr:hypothetical protein DPEC_G00283080 [Dallia pectoralis]
MMDTGRLMMTKATTPTTTATPIKDRIQMTITNTDTVMVENHTSHTVKKNGLIIAARRQRHGRPRECTERRPTPDIELQPSQSLTDVSSNWCPRIQQEIPPYIRRSSNSEE